MHDLIQIRTARPDDAGKLALLYAQVYIRTYAQEGISDEYANYIHTHFSRERFEKLLETHPESLRVAEYKHNLVGVAEMIADQPCPVRNLTATEISKLYVLEWFCGKGIGTRLLLECEAALRSKGMTEFWLWVLDSNTRAIRFYEKNQCRWIGDAFYQMETNTFVHKVMYKQLSPVTNPT